MNQNLPLGALLIQHYSLMSEGETGYKSVIKKKKTIASTRYTNPPSGEPRGQNVTDSKLEEK